MSKTRDERKPDRYLLNRNDNYSYWRRAPHALVEAGLSPAWIKKSLKTSDKVIARMKRDLLEAADDEQWAALLGGEGVDLAHHNYMAAVKRAEVLGLRYRTWSDVVAMGQPSQTVARIETAMATATPKEKAASLGLTNKPGMTVSRAMAVYKQEIVAHEHVKKSKPQRNTWDKVKQRAVNNFIKVVGDKAMTDITRDDALAFYKYWQDRVTGKPGVKKAGASAGNRDLGNMRLLHRDYFRHIGDRDRENPFRDLSYKVIKKSRPPFPTEWIREKIMAPGALSTLNAEARGILLVVLETGARPSEICNLGPSQIRLDHKIPHIKIEPRDDPNDPREIKTESSIREVPLIGVALAVMHKFPNGFPRYRNKEDTLSAKLNLHLEKHNLLPSPQHKPYSLRHSFEDRMKEHLEFDQRKAILGHTVDRPKYGTGGELQWKLDGLKKIELPFDPSIV